MLASLLWLNKLGANFMRPSQETKLAELNAFLRWLETGRGMVQNNPDHAELLAILESAIAKTKSSLQTLVKPKSN
jgi:hypothetical protein